MGDLAHFIGENGVGDGVDTGLSQRARDGWPGEIGLGAGGAAVADGEDDGAGAGCKTCGHRYSLPLRDRMAAWYGAPSAGFIYT